MCESGNFIPPDDKGGSLKNKKLKKLTKMCISFN